MGNTGWSNQTNRRLVVVEGSAYTGLFFYQPTAATGNLVGSWTAQAGTDPYGNSYPAGINVTGGTITGVSFLGMDFVISDAGIFFYSGTPAAGNLALSLAFVAGTDPYGNVYPSGVNVESGLQQIVLGLTGGLPLIYFVTGLALTSSSALQAIISGTGTGRFDFFQILSSVEPTHNDLVLQSFGGSSPDGTTRAQITQQYKDSTGTYHVFYTMGPTGPDFPQGVASGGQVAVTRAADSSAVAATYSAANPTNAAYTYTAAAATGRLLGATVTGDTVGRFVMDVNGMLNWGSGAAARDTMLARTAAGILTLTGALDGAVFADTWHAVTPATGWTQGVSPNPQLSYKALAEKNTAWLIGSMTYSGTPAGGTVVCNLPAAYRPTTVIQISDAYDTTNSALVPIEIATNGNVTVQHATGTNPNLWINSLIALDLP